VLGGDVANCGIPNAQVLVEFAEAAVGDDPLLLDAARAAVISEMGGEALCDAAGVAAMFNAVDRVADASGIPVENGTANVTDKLREELGINQFGVIPDDAAAAQ
jgi:hypothetical protein